MTTRKEEYTFACFASLQYCIRKFQTGTTWQEVCGVRAEAVVLPRVSHGIVVERRHRKLDRKLFWSGHGNRWVRPVRPVRARAHIQNDVGIQYLLWLKIGSNRGYISELRGGLDEEKLIDLTELRYIRVTGVVEPKFAIYMLGANFQFVE